jgi:hypothetical protein
MDKVKVRALKSVPSFGLVSGQVYLLPPYDAALCVHVGFVEYVSEKRKPGRPRKEA